MPRLGGAVKTLMMANVIVFLIVWLGTRVFAGDVEAARAWVNTTFGLHPVEWTLPFIPVWQFVSYAFVHAGLMHLFWNMLQLYFSGLCSRGFWAAGASTWSTWPAFSAELPCIVWSTHSGGSPIYQPWELPEPSSASSLLLRPCGRIRLC